MDIKLDNLETLLVAIIVLYLGKILDAKIHFLNKNNIPIPVTGGIVFAVLISLGHTGLGTTVTFDMDLKTPMMIAFFTTVGLSIPLHPGAAKFYSKKSGKPS